MATKENSITEFDEEDLSLSEDLTLCFSLPANLLGNASLSQSQMSVLFCQCSIRIKLLLVDHIDILLRPYSGEICV